MLDLYGESGDPDARAWIAYALAMKTRWLLRAGLSDQAITTSDELIGHVERETDPAALGTAAEMRLNAGTCLADPAALASRRPRAKRLTPVIRICLANIDVPRNGRWCGGERAPRSRGQAPSEGVEQDASDALSRR